MNEPRPHQTDEQAAAFLEAFDLSDPAIATLASALIRVLRGLPPAVPDATGGDVSDQPSATAPEKHAV